MNRNTVIGLLLIGAIFIGWSIMMQPTEEERLANERRLDSIAQERRTLDSLRIIEAARNQEAEAEVMQPASTEGTPVVTETVTRQNTDRFGDFSNSALREDQYFVLENDVYKIKVLNKGGRIFSVELKDYVTSDSLPLFLFDSDTSHFGFVFYNQNRDINTNDLYFQPFLQEGFIPDSKEITVTGQDSVQFAMRLYVDAEESAYNADKYIEYLYTLYGDKYRMGFNVNLVGINDIISTRYNTLDLRWEANLRLQEKAVDQWNKPTAFFKFYRDDVDNIPESDDEGKESIKTKVKWISFKQHFFCSTIIAEDYFENAEVETFTDLNPSNPKYLKTMATTIGLPYNNQPYQSIPMSFYFGPLKYKILKKEQLDMEKQIPLGWSFFLLAWINIYIVIPVFDFLGSFGWNYGIVILILTILLKIVLFPIAYKTYISSAKMRALKPEIDEIGKKFPKKEDAMKKQQATMALYKSAGVNPMAGCIPMLLQFPILIAMFRFFPSSIELRQKSFLWATDLSSYDSIWNFPDGFSIPFYGDHVSLFTLLMTVSTILYTRMNNQMMASSQQMPGMKTMMYLMPIMFLGIFNNYSSGLSYYYFLANIITFGQMYIFRVAIDEDKLHRKIQANKKKPKKKSGFQKRLEEAAKKRGYKPPKK